MNVQLRGTVSPPTGLLASCLIFKTNQQISDFKWETSTEINGIIVGIKYIFENIKNWQRNGTKVSRL